MPVAETRAKKLDQGVKAAGGGADSHDKARRLAMARLTRLEYRPARRNLTNGYRASETARAFGGVAPTQTSTLAECGGRSSMS